MAMRRSAEKTDVKVNLWVTTGDGRNRSTRFKRLSFCKSNLRMLPPPLLLYCGSALRLWIFHGKHLTPCPERYFKVFFFSDRNPGVRECHRGVKSVCGPQAKDRIYDAPVDDIRWIFSFLSGEPPLSSATDKPLSCSQFVVTPQKICFVCGILLSREMISICSSASCVLTNCDRFPRLISVELEWLSRGESAWISSVLNAAFSILHCPLAFSSRYLSCFHLCRVSPSSLTKARLCNSSF